MALADFPLSSSLSPSSALGALAEWLASRRQARARKTALNELMNMPEHRLRDLGIEPRQVMRAIDEHYWPTRK